MKKFGLLISIVSIVSIVSLCAGSVGGFLVAKRKYNLKTEYLGDLFVDCSNDKPVGLYLVMDCPPEKLLEVDIGKFRVLKNNGNSKPSGKA
jgi:hypothetical protein